MLAGTKEWEAESVTQQNVQLLQASIITETSSVIVQAAYILTRHRYTIHKEIYKTKYFVICKLLGSSSDDELLVTHAIVV